MMTQAATTVQLQVTWVKAKGGGWCKLNTVDLSHPAVQVEGVYVIWCGPTDLEKAAVVYVGQGVVKDRLADHRDDARIQKYAPRTLYVTWAAVEARKREGVEAYLSKRYAPLVGERRPTATPISVNSPWD
jgi:hypothetical protein